jgi:DNA polymerase elongation subunit (family B)
LEKFVGKENVLYGDTDSIYLVGANNKIVAEARDKFNVRLEVDKVWKILFLTSNKKQYVGLTAEGELEYTTMTGMKSNQPLYYNEVAQKLISKEFLEAFIDTSAEIALERIVKYIPTAFIELQLSDNLDKLSFSFESNEPLYTHKNNNIQQQIYEEILEECGNDTQLAHSKSEAGHVYRYWKIKAKNRKATIHPEKYELDMQKYKEGLFNCIKPELEVFGMSESEISQLYNELVNNAQMMNTLMMIKS